MSASPESRPGTPASWPETSSLEIGPATVAALLAAPGGKFRLIDCREPDEWDLCRIDGAELLPLGDIPSRHAGALPDPDESIVIHCHHGVRSAKAAHFLRQKGYSRVWSMARGIEGWSLEVDPAVPRY